MLYGSIIQRHNPDALTRYHQPAIALTLRSGKPAVGGLRKEHNT